MCFVCVCVCSRCSCVLSCWSEGRPPSQSAPSRPSKQTMSEVTSAAALDNFGPGRQSTAQEDLNFVQHHATKLDLVNMYVDRTSLTLSNYSDGSGIRHLTEPAEPVLRVEMISGLAATDELPSWSTSQDVA